MQIYSRYRRSLQLWIARSLMLRAHPWIFRHNCRTCHIRFYQSGGARGTRTKMPWKSNFHPAGFDEYICILTTNNLLLNNTLDHLNILLLTWIKTLDLRLKVYYLKSNKLVQSTVLWVANEKWWFTKYGFYLLFNLSLLFHNKFILISWFCRFAGASRNILATRHFYYFTSENDKWNIPPFDTRLISGWCWLRIARHDFLNFLKWMKNFPHNDYLFKKFPRLVFR